MLFSKSAHATVNLHICCCTNCYYLYYYLHNLCNYYNCFYITVALDCYQCLYFSDVDVSVPGHESQEDVFKKALVGQSISQCMERNTTSSPTQSCTVRKKNHISYSQSAYLIFSIKLLQPTKYKPQIREG